MPVHETLSLYFKNFVSLSFYFSFVLSVGVCGILSWTGWYLDTKAQKFGVIAAAISYIFGVFVK
jgi:hypothetical protein